MKYWIALGIAAFTLTATAAAAVAPPAPDSAANASGRSDPANGRSPLSSNDGETPDLRVLLSSIDMTVSLIDAYGQCREGESSHKDCMAIIRETLDHARRMIGH
jgi:hypothetical protein